MCPEGRIDPADDGSRRRVAGRDCPQFGLDAGSIHALLAAYLPFTDTVDTDHDTSLDIPLCSDPDDQMFLRLAADGRAEVLVSGDRAILELGEPVPLAIETAAAFRKRFG